MMKCFMFNQVSKFFFMLEIKPKFLYDKCKKLIDIKSKTKKRKKVEFHMPLVVFSIFLNQPYNLMIRFQLG